jgi:hypothetical protein
LEGIRFSLPEFATAKEGMMAFGFTAAAFRGSAAIGRKEEEEEGGLVAAAIATERTCFNLCA